MFIGIQKVAETFVRPKDMTKNAYKLYRVIHVVFDSSLSLIRT